MRLALGSVLEITMFLFFYGLYGKVPSVVAPHIVCD